MATWDKIRKSKEWNTICKTLTDEEKYYLLHCSFKKHDEFVNAKLKSIGSATRSKSIYLDDTY